MKKPHHIAIALAVAIAIISPAIGLFAVFAMAEDKNKLPPLECPTPISESPYRANYSADEHYTGHYQGDGFAIVWAGTTKKGATIDDVLDALVHRAEFEQSTELASNDKAKALAFLNQARAALAGQQTQTEDGTPIIE